MAFTGCEPAPRKITTNDLGRQIERVNAFNFPRNTISFENEIDKK